MAACLVGRNILSVLVERDGERLDQHAARLERELRTIVAGSREEIATEMRRQRPTLVINTIGSFTQTT